MPNVFDLEGSISMDTSGFEKAVKDAMKDGNNLAKALQQNAAQMKAMQDQIDKLSAELNSANSEINSLKAELDKASKAADENADSTANMAKEADKSADSNNDLRAVLEKIVKSVDSMVEVVKDLGKQEDKTADKTDEYADAAGEAKEETDRFEKSASKLGDTAKNVAGHIGDLAGKIKDALVDAAKVGAAAVGAASAAVAGLAKSAVSNYSEYEQLVGGVETLFKSSSDTVLKNAEEAYKTAGISANAYMETVTSFSASLIQSTGRVKQIDLDELKDTLDAEYKATKASLQDQYDATKEYWNKRIKATSDSGTKSKLQEQRDAELKALKKSNEAKLEELKSSNKKVLAETEKSNSQSTTTAESLEKAAKLADQAIIDMSDNANKMGTDMQSIMNAYQGFAKGNYTMLDNLKLGFGGTKEEMERLITTAEQLTGKDLDISSYADIVEAIHAVQVEMGITGTTAEEAAGTIQGSAGAMRAAWENLVTGLANPEADLGQLIDNFVSSAETSIGNILPIVQQALNGIGKLIEQLAPVIGEKLPEMIEQTLPQLVKTGASLAKSLGVGLAKSIPVLLPYVRQLISQAVDAIIKYAPQAIKQLAVLFKELSQWLSDNMPMIIDTAIEIINVLIQGIVDNLPMLVDAALTIVESLAEYLTQALPELIPAIVGIVVEIAKTLTEPENIQRLISCAVDLILALADGLLEALPVLIEALPVIVQNLVEGLTSEESIGKIIDGMIEIVGKLAEWLLDPENLAMLVVAAGQIIWALIKGMVNIQVEIWKTLGNILAECGRTIYGYGEQAFNWGKDLIMKIIDGIKSMAGEVGDAISDIIPDGIKDVFGGVKNTAKKILPFAEGGITAHATGGYMIQSPVLTTSGDLFGEAGREAILPLDNNTEWMDKLADRIDRKGSESPVIIQEVNINFPEGLTIGSDYDTDRMIERISEQLESLKMAQTAAVGGANW